MTVDNQLWALYKQTVFLISQRLAEGGEYAIITAYNPLGKVSSASSNQSQDMCLQQYLENLGVPYRSLLGCAPDFSYYEKSWAVWVDKAQAINIANIFEQNAIYYIEQNRLYLVPVCMQGQQEEDLGPFDVRLCREGHRQINYMDH